MKPFSPASLAFMAVIFPTIIADIVFTDLRYLKAYTEDTHEGPVHEFLDYAPDLSVYSIDNAIKSVCYTGLWFLYDETNYQGALVGSFGSLNHCASLSTSNWDEASSLRYAGSPNGLDDVYYNLYEHIYYAGAEFTGNTNAPTVGSLDLNVSSLAITGQSPWTFFTGQEYTGVAVCVFPSSVYYDDDIYFHYNSIYSMDDIGLPNDSIRSVARGCLSERIVREPSSKASLPQVGASKASLPQDGDEAVIDYAY